MKQFLKELWCIIAGHDWAEFSEKRMGNYTYYKDRKCGCCGYTEILKNEYYYEIKFLDKDGKILSDTKIGE